MTFFSPAPKPQPREKKLPKPPRKKNAQRSADQFTRCYHSQERVEWVQEQPCIVTGCRRQSENAHIEIDGAGLKADYTKIAPICGVHHRTGTDSLHNLGREAFEGEHMVDLGALALDLERCWRRYAGHQPDEAVVIEIRGRKKFETQLGADHPAVALTDPAGD